MGLTTKRLSGAQKKKMRRAQKEAAGTWTKDKPKSKREQQQQQQQKTATTGGAGPSGERGSKRPHSDSSTPQSATRQPKKPRSAQAQTGAYSSIAAGFKMAVLH